MMCESCQGKGRVTGLVCIECFGTGIVSCCEGSERHGQLDSYAENAALRAEVERNAETARVMSRLHDEEEARAEAAEAAAAPPVGEDVVERLAHTLCQSGRFETGQGTCALACMDQLGDARGQFHGCSHAKRIHGDFARAILSAIQSTPAP